MPTHMLPASRTHRCERPRVRGQAMVEFTLIASFCSLALFAMPALADLSVTRLQTVSAAKLLAWQRTVWIPDKLNANDRAGVMGAITKSDQEMTRDLARHVFRDRSRPTIDMHAKEFSEFEADAPPVLKNTRIAAHTTDADLPPVANAIDTVLDAVGTAQKILGGNKLTPSLKNFRLMSGGYFRNQVDVVQENTNFKLFPQARMTAQVTMLSEAWNAGGTMREETKIQGLVPMKIADSEPLRQMRNAMQQVARSIHYVFPAFDVKQLEIGLNPGKAEERSPTDRFELTKRAQSDPKVKVDDRFRWYRSFPPPPVVYTLP